MNLDWLTIPAVILAFAVLVNGWPPLVTINHYHDKSDEDE